MRYICHRVSFIYKGEDVMKKLKDERIINQTNKILSPMYFLTLVLLILGICIKWQFTREITMYIIEILVIP